ARCGPGGRRARCSCPQCAVFPRSTATPLTGRRERPGPRSAGTGPLRGVLRGSVAGELGAQGGQGLIGGQGALVRGARLVGGLRGRSGLRGGGGGGRGARGLLV